MDPSTAGVVWVAVTFMITLWILRKKDGNAIANTNDIPDAVAGNLLVGNALQYKKNPTGCIREQEKATRSKIFRINLAGRKMIVVGSDAHIMKQIANQPESILSSCRAVAELGFEHTLGNFNVYHGTAWHKQILKNYIMGENFATKFLPGIFQGLFQAMETEIGNLPTVDKVNDDLRTGPDVFGFVRRCVLRATLDEFVSPLLLQKDPSLLSELMVFQDRVEDATAKAAVLPRIVALPLCLWPTKRARKSIEKRIGGLLPAIWKARDARLGPWAKTYMEDGTTPELAAEHLVGLIFAAHKNPSIGAAQAFCFLRSELTREQQVGAEREARELCQQFASPRNDNLTKVLLQAKTLRMCVLETLRVTTHTLGAVRYANKSLEVQTKDPKRSHTIMEGETVSLAHHTMHMESSIWGEDAEVFSLDRPEWNEDGRGQIGIPVDHFKLTTFSNGLHVCPGERVALAMMQLQLSLLLMRNTQILGDLAPISFERATLAQRDGPVPFTVKARSHVAHSTS